MNTIEGHAYEKRLLEEIEKIGHQILELEQEKHALERQLIKARHESYALRDVKRKNSITRALVEDIIIKELSSSKKPMKSQELFHAAQYANLHMKNNTFRTYLHRMLEKGMIKRIKTATWVLSGYEKTK
ncbi:hypothetical protein WJT86_03500 [Microvirga sp. W0021]|uniref:Uncharacterized protein n=1 Tax=Hohaiivirga grylli TaxID=3133970 RepID=A0ABV0BKS6_9HYPH